ncbi:MAG: heparinase II/III family protein, partial [Blastocatellia bacterium]
MSNRFRRAPKMSDEELAHEFHPIWRDGTGEEAADALRCRMRARSQCFLPSLEQRGKVVEMMNRRFPAECDAIIKTAEAALRGTFSPLGRDMLNLGDPKVIREHAHFVTLGQAYWLTNDNRFAEGFRDQVSAWIAANPAPLGIKWASGPEVAFRSIAWLWATRMFVDSGRVTPDFFARLLKSLIEHGRHIEKSLSYHFSPNIHLTG